MPVNGSTRASNKMIWAGRILAGISVLFMIFDAVSHIAKPAPVVDAFVHLGYPLSVAVPLGIIELVCIGLYVVPRTSIFGALLLTGYLGGAVASHVRVGDPVFEMVFPVIVAALVWGGLFPRDSRVRALFR